MTELRALLLEMADALDHDRQCLLDDRNLTHPLADKARAALAAEEAGPSDERIAALEQELERERIRLAACGVIAMADTPESAAEARNIDPCYHSASLDDVIRQVDALMVARAVIARHGSAPRPVPVAERLPGPEDCDAKGRCWVHQPREFAPEQPAWELMRAKYAASNYGATHWLPAHALPLPENADD